MSRKSLVRRWAAWLAVWAVVLHALAPGMAQAVLRWTEPDLTHEICVSTGIVRLAEPAADDRVGVGAATAGLDCEWCLLHLALDLPPADRLQLDRLPLDSVSDVVPAAPILAAPWRRAQPRAPPAFA